MEESSSRTNRRRKSPPDDDHRNENRNNRKNEIRFGGPFSRSSRKRNVQQGWGGKDRELVQR